MTLFTGSAASQAITLLMAPILARIYAAEAFGAWALFIAVSSLLSTISAGRYDTAIMLPENISGARKLVFISLSHVALVALLCCISVCIIWLSSRFYDVHFHAGWLLLPVSVFVTGSSLVFTSLLIRGGRYPSISKTRVTQSAVVAASNLAGGYLLMTGATAEGGLLLIIATTLGQCIGLFMNIFAIGIRRLRLLLTNFHYDFGTLNKYRDFPLYSMPEAALGAALTSMPVYIFTYLMGGAVAGQYSLAQRCLMLPVAVLGGAMSQVNFREFARINAKGEAIQGALFRAWLRAALFAVLPSLILLFFAGDLFRLVFGGQWGLAGEMAAVLAIPTFVTFVFTVGSSAHVVLRIQHLSLAVAVCSLLIKLAIVGAMLNETSLRLLVGLTAVDIIMIVALNAYVYIISKRPQNA